MVIYVLTLLYGVDNICLLITYYNLSQNVFVMYNIVHVILSDLFNRGTFKLDSYLDPSFMSLIKDPDLRRKEQWEKSSQAQKGFNYARLLGYGDIGFPPLSAAEEYSLHSRYLAKANSLNLSEIAEMKIMYVNSLVILIFIEPLLTNASLSLHMITFSSTALLLHAVLMIPTTCSYRGGVDSEGRPVMVVVGAHFLLRCLDLERFVLHVVKVIMRLKLKLPNRTSAATVHVLCLVPMSTYLLLYVLQSWIAVVCRYFNDQD